MIIYSVACTLDKEIADEWKQFFLNKHLQDVLSTGCFKKYTFRQLIPDEPSNKVTFVAEYYANSMADFKKYQNNYAPALRTETGELFKGKYNCQRSFYEVIA